MTIVVINNHGGAIFSLLPIAKRTKPSVLEKHFYTSHTISISNLCEAHSLKHLHVSTKSELQNALWISQQAQTDCVIEVESCIKDNASFHSILTKSACQAADHALSILSRLSILDHVSNGAFLIKILKMEYLLYRIQLCGPPTSASVNNEYKSFYKEGFILTLFIEDGSVGFGEVAPIEIHKEDLLDVEEQLRFLIHKIKGAGISCLLPLLKGSISSWIWKSIGVPPFSIFPSVRCGLEMAILNALAAKQGSSLSHLILGSENLSVETELHKEDNITERSSMVKICGLIDSNGTPEEVAHLVAKLVDQGFDTVKLKVGRRVNHLEDAAVVREIRQKVGYQIKLRVDANRKWTYEEAIQFASCVKCYQLQYIEEPVCNEDDIVKFCEETGLPAALDETIDNIEGDPFVKLSEFLHLGIVAIVIKPSVVGGFENAALIAKWAQQHDKMAVISSAFESSLSLSTYVQFVYYLQQQNREICRIKNKELTPIIAHGLGTFQWLREDVTIEPLKICKHPYGDAVEASVKDAAMLLHNFQINHEVVQRSYFEEPVLSYQLSADFQNFSCCLNVRDTGTDIDDKVIVFLHGFLGTGEDWVPIMKALSGTVRCISVDLPGHGKSKAQKHGDTEANQEPSISIEVVAHVLLKVIHHITSRKIVLVGYSMGARIALYMALRCNEKIDGAVIVSGSPGLNDVAARRIRAAQDDARAHYLIGHGLSCFLESWYAGELWNSLRGHPCFDQIAESRVTDHDDVNALAKSLSDLSLGRQPSLWEDLKHCKKPLLFIVGEKDRKFKEIAQKMYLKTSSGSDNEGNQSEMIHQMLVVPDCGHAVHLENPLPMINAVRKFLKKQAT